MIDLPNDCGNFFGDFFDPGNSITKASGQPIQDGGFQKEPLDRFRLAMQHFIGKVIHNVAVATGEGLDKSGNVVAELHR